MSLRKLLLEAVSRVLPPAAEWLAGKLMPNDSKSSNSSAKPNSSAESNRHATQSGAARNASSDATEKMMQCVHDWQPSSSVSPKGPWRCSKCPAIVGGFPSEFAERASRALGTNDEPTLQERLDAKLPRSTKG